MTDAPYAPPTLPLRLAAVAEDEGDGSASTAAVGQLELPAHEHSDAHLDELCEHLAWWANTRRLWGAPKPRPNMQLGKLVKRTRPLRGEPPDAACSMQMQALWIALVAQPSESLDRVVFELHYLHRVTNVKAASAAIGIGRQHWYTLLRDFRRRIYIASRDVMAANEDAALRLGSRH